MKHIDHIFVFGSNLAGKHGKGAALTAANVYGAEQGVGAGRMGYAYAIPTKDHLLRQLSLAVIKTHINTFMEYARLYPEVTFHLTKVGCGLAGYAENQIAPMFAQAPGNVVLVSNQGQVICHADTWHVLDIHSEVLNILEAAGKHIVQVHTPISHHGQVYSRTYSRIEPGADVAQSIASDLLKYMGDIQHLHVLRLVVPYETRTGRQYLIRCIPPK